MEFSVEKVVNTNISTLATNLIQANIVKGKVQDIRLQINQIEEIGDGNLNIVYRVVLQYDRGDVHLIVKYAPPYIKVLGPSFPLSQHRLEVEYSALRLYHTLSPGSVPVPFLFDKQECSIFMEDLRGWSILRTELIEGRVDIEAIKSLMVSVATAHNQSDASVCTKEKHQKLQESFSNKEMVSVTEQYVFAKPFAVGDSTNRHDPLLDEEVKEMRSNAKCCQRAEEMKRLFVQCKECFCHGDLHTGSVMVNNGKAKMFDIEFALMGPHAFDLGMFLANLIFAFVRHQVLNNLPVTKEIRSTIDVAIHSYIKASTLTTEASKFTGNTCGFIGCELIRRVVGAAHVSDFSSMPEGELKALRLGKAFLVAETSEHSDLVTMMSKLLE